MIQRNPPQDDRRLLTGIGVAVLLLLFFAVLHGFVVVETYELAAFEAHRSCTQQRGARSCDGLLPPWHADEPKHRTLRARFAALVGQLPDLTLDAADAAKNAATDAFDALTIASESQET
jgi:hypothetical protein